VYNKKKKKKKKKCIQQRAKQKKRDLIQSTEDRRQKFFGHKMIQCLADKNFAVLLFCAQQLAVMFCEKQRQRWEFMKGYLAYFQARIGTHCYDSKNTILFLN
jgi:hypothetical protein